jgi:hypothetical protein
MQQAKEPRDSRANWVSADDSSPLALLLANFLPIRPHPVPQNNLCRELPDEVPFFCSQGKILTEASSYILSIELDFRPPSLVSA